MDTKFLGQKMTDQLSGFTGTCVAVVDYLTGCRQFLIHPGNVDKDGKPGESIWFDESRVLPEAWEKLVAGEKAESVSRGGPSFDVPRPRS